MGYGVQLYSVNDFMDTDMEYTFSRLAELGYTSVEFASFFNHTPEEITSLVKKYNFTIDGAHVHPKLIDADFKGIVEFHKAIGNKNIVIPDFETYHADQAANLIKFINKYQPMFEAEGITLHFHNHDREFKPNKDGIVVFDMIVNETNINLQIDTFWVFFAGADPVKVMEDYKDRIKFVHLKDGNENRQTKALGEGIAPVAECVAKAKELGFKMIVESEGQVPTGIAEVKRCIKYLKKLDNPTA